ncbi:hemolysin secretion protein D [Thioclava sp. SK-1]|nr:hemolysin secretion protein D [Thioclava sp. SK-1]
MSRHIATIVAVLIGLCGVLGILYAWNLPPFQQTTRLTDDAYVRGQVTYISSQVAGNVADVPVQDYQQVKKGDLLLQIDDTSYRQSLAQAQAQLEAAQANVSALEQTRRTDQAQLASAQAGVASAQAALNTEKANLDRSDALIKRGVITQQDADAEKLTYEQAKATLSQAKAEVEVAQQTVNSIISQHAALAAAVKQQEAAVALAQINLSHTKIVAPVDGTLGAVSAHTGQYVSAGTRLMSIVPNTIWIVANFKETQLAGIEIGQPVTFTVDALNNAVLTGKIERFAPATGSEFSILASSNATGNFVKVAHRLAVRITIDPNQALAAQLAPGMSVVVSAAIAQTKAPETSGAAANG